MVALEGLTVAYYHAFADNLLPHLKSYSTLASAGGGFRLETLHAHITVLPKPGKDPSLCGSYCPISLLNLDVKLYAKVIATPTSDSPVGLQ